MEKYINETSSMGRMIAVEHDGYGPPIDLSAQISQVDTMGVIFGIVADMPRVCTLYASSRFSGKICDCVGRWAAKNASF